MPTDPSLPDRMAAIADDFLAALDRQGRGCAQLPFTDEDERTRWFYTPVLRAGLPLRDMDPAQQRLAHRLLALGLSAPGYVTASTIIGLENTLDAEEGFVRDWYEGRGRDPQMYYLSVFGDPGAPAWGWRFEGHHVSVHYTIVDGVIATPTPLFFGADPAESAMLGADVLRPLAGATDLAREVMHALDEEQRAAATLSPIAPPDIMLTNHSRIAEGLQPRPTFAMMDVGVTPERLRRDEEARRASGLTPELEDALVYRARPRGLAVAGMTIAQRDIVAELIGQYVGRLPDELAAIESARLGGDAIDAVHFGWAGELEPRRPHYYRLHGPRFLVEYDCVQRGANHIHSVWRDPEADFGRDVLARHYAASH